MEIWPADCGSSPIFLWRSTKFDDVEGGRNGIYADV
jgi:hypothetical protein